MYHAVTLGPSEGQMSDLAQGDAIQLSPKHFTGDVQLKLTTTQLKRIQKAKAAGRGCTLRFTPAQIRHMAQMGSGRFTDLLRSGVNYVKPIVRRGIAKGLDMGADFVSGKLTGAVKQGNRFVKKKIGVQEGEGWLGKLAKKAAHGGVDFVGDMMGIGAKPANRRPTGPARRAEPMQDVQGGAGWIGKLGKKIAHGGVDFVGDMLGVGVAPNPKANTNEALRAAMFQKKVPVAAGSGLKF